MNSQPVRTTTKPSLDVCTDAELMNELTAAKGRNDRCFAELAVRHERLIMNVLRRRNIRSADRDELANKALIKLWKIARDGKWDVAKAKHSDDPFLPLLCRIVSSTAGDFHRETQRRNRHTKRVAEAMEAYGERWQTQLTPASVVEARSEATVPSGVPEILQDAVAALPEKLRTVFTFHADGQTNRAIAKAVGCSWGEVSKRLKKAREILRETANLAA